VTPGNALPGPPPLVYVVSGPSGSGKTSLCAQARSELPWLRPSVSHTTRSPRPGETPGEDYIFVSRAAFMEQVGRGAFLEWAEVHGHLYGTSLRNLESLSPDQALLFEVDCKGARAIRDRLPQAVLIFIMTPTFEDLVARIGLRGRMSAQELAVRIRTAREELRQVGAFSYVVVNDRFSEASADFQSILRAGRCRREHIPKAWTDRWTAAASGADQGPGARPREG